MSRFTCNGIFDNMAWILGSAHGSLGEREDVYEIPYLVSQPYAYL